MPTPPAPRLEPPVPLPLPPTPPLPEPLPPTPPPSGPPGPLLELLHAATIAPAENIDSQTSMRTLVMIFFVSLRFSGVRSQIRLDAALDTPDGVIGGAASQVNLRGDETRAPASARSQDHRQDG
jgi:hypothetical protein